MSIHWSAPAWLWPLLPVVAAGAVLWAVAMYRRTRPAVAPRLRRTLMALRAAAFVLLVAAVAAPVVSRLGSDTVPAEVLVVVEDSGSMAVGDAAAGRPRWQQAVRVAALADSLAGAAGHEARVTVLAGNGLGALAPLVAEAEPDARGTDLNALAGQALRRAAGGPVRALVLVSDGQETRSAGPARGAAAAPRAVVVGVGDPQGPADRMIRDLRYPDTVHRGDGIVVELLVDHRPAAAAATGDLRVTLTGPEGVLADTVLAATGGAVPVTLTVPADAEGLLVGELTVSPLDNERFLANNSASLAVDVRRARARVLLLADRPGWDVRFLAQAAAAEPRLDLTVVHPTAGGMVRADSLVAWTPPAGLRAWQPWDAVVVTGWRGPLGALDWPGLAAAVRQGKGLLVLPGAGADLPGSPGRPPSDLADLLPISGEPHWMWQGGAWPVAVAGGQRHPLLAGVAEGVGQWPPVLDLVPARLQPEALGLLAARERHAAGDSAGLPLLAAGRADQGRVVWYGGRRLWELAFAEVASGRAGAGGVQGGEGAGRRLLRNLLVWVAVGDRDAGLVFAGRRNVHPEGEPIGLEARWRDVRGAPVTGRAATVRVRRADADSSRFPVRTHALRPAADGALTVELPPLPPGRWEATLQGAGDPPVEGATLAFVVAAQSVEAGQVRRDQRRLDLLARSLDAAVVDGDGAGLAASLAAALAPVDWSPTVTPRRQRLDLWSGWPFLSLVVALLGGEWYLRRRHGLL
ncbi:MAG: hypothetical protein ABR506_10885 [Candidatus Krumholzibacteriia bacterium]